jgi:hypothetical protein
VLLIRQAQMKALQDLPRLDLEDQLIRQFSRHYPRECNSAGPEEMRRFVRTGLQRAAGYGFLTIDTAASYIHVMIMLGWAFDSDPQLSWARTKLTDYAEPPARRIHALAEAAIDYLGRVAGEDGEKIVRAMIRIRKHDFLAPCSSTGEQFQHELLHLLARLYPEKAAFQGDEVNRLFIAHAAQDAGLHGFTESNGIAVYTTLAFMLGVGFATDPLYGWAGATLQATRGEPEEERASRLAKRSLEHIEASLHGLEESHERQE